MARQPGKTAQETRELIVNTAYIMFGLNGFDGVSIQEISTKSKLSKGALYWHFDNKEALYFECLKKFRHILRAKVFVPMVGIESPAKQIGLFFTGTNDLLKDDQLVDCTAGYLLGMGRDDKATVTYFRERIFSESETFLSDILDKGRVQGRFDFEGKPEPIARSLWAIMEGCILQMRRQSPKEIEETMYALWDIFTKGIGLSVKPENETRYQLKNPVA